MNYHHSEIDSLRANDIKGQINKYIFM
jgi:hypothetical protein